MSCNMSCVECRLPLLAETLRLIWAMTLRPLMLPSNERCSMIYMSTSVTMSSSSCWESVGLQCGINTLLQCPGCPLWFQARTMPNTPALVGLGASAYVTPACFWGVDPDSVGTVQ